MVIVQRVYFNHENPDNGEMQFKKSDIFNVIDTLHGGTVGSWKVFKIGWTFIKYLVH